MSRALLADISLTLALSLAIIVGPACSFDPLLPNARYQCDPKNPCPEGFSCVKVDGLFLKDGNQLQVCCTNGNCASGLDDQGRPRNGVIGRPNIAPFDVEPSASGTGGKPTDGGGGGGATGGEADGGSGGTVAGDASGTGGTGGRIAGDGGGGATATGGATGTGGSPPPDAQPEVPTCQPLCASGDVRCGPNGGTQPCAFSNGCYVWGAETACGAHARCAGAPRATCACQPPPSGCMPTAGSYCSSATTLETCAADGDDCIYKQTPKTCPAGKPCSGSYGAASCSCTQPPAACQNVTGTVCSGGGGFVTCGYDTNQCLTIQGTMTCTGGQVCAGAAGSAGCRCPADPPECMGVKNGTVCSGNTIISCSTTAGGCVVATTGQTCASGKPCGGPVGAAACVCPSVPACNGPGAANGSSCSNNDVLTCAADGNGCQQASITNCPSGKPCGGNFPGAQCTCPAAPPACLSGGNFTAGKVCVSGGVATCQNDGNNGCPTITAAAGCGAPQTCQGSLPSAACACPSVPACAGTPNGTHCADASTLVTCSDNNSCQQSATASCKTENDGLEGCVGAYPAAKCEKSYGYVADLGSSGTIAAGFLFAVSVQVDAPLTLKRIGLIAQAASMHARMAVYTDNGGTPDTWEASAIASTQTVTAGRNEYAVNDLSANPTVLAAGRYWIVGVFEASTQLRQGGNPVAVRYIASWNPWNTPFPRAPLSTATHDNLAPVNFYLVGVP